jgi:hypothetical protein
MVDIILLFATSKDCKWANLPFSWDYNIVVHIIFKATEATIKSKV